MPRPKREEPYVRKQVLIDESTWEKVELLLRDPRTGRARHGTFSQLTTALLENWANKQIEARTPAAATPHEQQNSNGAE